jgi:DNA (cytosine-5)-methyltransferase 1
MNYYSDNDPYVVQWLANLIRAKLIPFGYVDDRSITDVQRLEGFSQCHFFGGIAGWPLALMLAGWPPERPVWTGSCPCQPFSSAGQRKGKADERHLWPEWLRLITQYRPPTIFGEQVASRLGREWLSAVRTDLEALGYAVGAADLCAASVGAPHIRQRLFFVAHSECARLEVKREQQAWQERATTERSSASGCMEHTASEQVGFPGRTWEQGNAAGVLGNPNGARPSEGSETAALVGYGDSAFATGSGSWSDLEWLPCIDGKWRPTQPGLQPLAHGVSARVGKLRAYGNAIVPQVAAEFIKASMLSI